MHIEFQVNQDLCFLKGAPGKGTPACNGPMKGNKSISGLEKVSIYCFFTGWSCKGAFNGLEGGIAPGVATL